MLQNSRKSRKCQDCGNCQLNIEFCHLFPLRTAGDGPREGAGISHTN